MTVLDNILTVVRIFGGIGLTFTLTTLYSNYKKTEKDPPSKITMAAFGAGEIYGAAIAAEGIRDLLKGE